MLSEPCFTIQLVNNDAYLGVYEILPIEVAEINGALVRFGLNKAPEAMIIPRELYRLTKLVCHEQSITMKDLFKVLIHSGYAWRVVERTTRQRVLQNQLEQLVNDHRSIRRPNWHGGRRVFTQRISWFFLVYLWRPFRWERLRRLISFERRWLSHQNDPELLAAIENIVARQHAS